MYRRAYFGAVGRDCRSICRRTFDISGFPVRKLIYRREETSGRIGIGCSACVARTGTHEFRIRTFDTSEICRLSARYASGANTGHFAPAGTRDDFSSVSSSRRFADGSTVRSISDGPARSECPAKSRFLSERGGFPVLRPDGYSDSLLSEVRTGQVVIRIGSDARDHLRKTRSISRRASFSLMYSRLS